MKLHLLFVVVFSIMALCLRADGPKDNIPDKVRPIPPIGIEIPEDIKEQLEAGLEELGAAIKNLKKQKGVESLVPDVEIYHKAVRYILEGRQFYKKSDFAMAEKLLEQGMERAQDLRGGKAPWTRQKGLVVRGYRSRIDGDVQPYGLVIP